MNRREFLIRSGAVAAGGVLGRVLASSVGAGGGSVRGVSIVSDRADPIASSRPARWAIGQLQQALAARGIPVRLCSRIDEANPADLCVIAAGGSSPFSRDAGVVPPPEAESLAIAPARLGGRDVLIASGRDVRGLVYALTGIADAVALDEAPQSPLHPGGRVTERPANSVRSVMRLFTSDVQDKPWFNDRGFWRDYLSMLAAQRFNRFNLALGIGYDVASNLLDTYFYFAYPFLVAVPGYEVRTTNLPDAERDRNLEMLRFISDEAAERGLDFQLGLWTHAYHWNHSPRANHFIEGLTPQTQAPYCRDALALILKECPNITGVTFRVHGESGVPEGSYDLWRIIFEGCTQSGRRIGLDLHAKGMDQPMIDIALGTGLPFTLSPKFSAEHQGLPYHQASIRPSELPRRELGSGLFAQSNGPRSFLRYGYGDLLREDRRYAIVHRVWPGTQRMLLWGDPTFAAAYGRAMSFCGSAGGELMEPLCYRGKRGSGLPGDRDCYADSGLESAHDFEKYRYTYRLWGRMLFAPDTEPETWRRQLRGSFGPAAAAAEGALAHASRILPLVTTAHMPSASLHIYWPEMYANMTLVGDAHADGPYGGDAPKRFGAVSPLDPQLFARIDDFADELIRGEVGGKYSPVEVAQWLEDLAQTAAGHLEQAIAQVPDRSAPAFRRLAVDVDVQVGLGRFFSRKLRAGVLFSVFERTGGVEALDESIKSYRAAREAWAHIGEVTAGVYADDMTYGPRWFERGDWSSRLGAIDKDITALEQKRTDADGSPASPKIAPEKVAALVREALGRPSRPAAGLSHVPPASFRQGEAVPIAFDLADGAGRPAAVKLHYRRTHQAEPWQTASAALEAGGGRAAVPADYTGSPYPLEYYFEATHASGQSTLYPGLGANLADQPYFVVRS